MRAVGRGHGDGTAKLQQSQIAIGKANGHVLQGPNVTLTESLTRTLLSSAVLRLNRYDCIYVHIYIHVYIYMYTYVYIYVYTFICVYISIYLCMCIYPHAASFAFDASTALSASGKHSLLLVSLAPRISMTHCFSTCLLPPLLLCTG